MRKIPVLIVLIAVIFTASCSKKTPEIASSIPEKAFVVASFHPKQLYDKGQIASFESILSKVNNDAVLSIIKDPASSGIALNEYAYIFSYIRDSVTVIGATVVLKDEKQFSSVIQNLIKSEDENAEINTFDGYSLFAPDNTPGGMMWNTEQLIFLTSPDNSKSTEEWKTELTALFNLSDEDAVTSVVDFKNFSGNMEDLNFWITGDQMKKFVEKMGKGKMNFNMPMDLYSNNYSQIFIEFETGAMYVHSENHLSDNVTKMADTFMVAKDKLNEDLLELAPGNNLLMAMAFSLDIEKMANLVKNFSPPEMNGLSDKIEQSTGVPGKDILAALSGDFVLAINGAPDGSAIPVEILIGIGLDDESLQEKLMGTVGNMTDVKKDGDFFTINANGIEIYSGIVNGVWVITNVSGYKDAISGKGLEKTLKDSKFNEYAEGSSGIYLNLDLSTYPAALQSMMAKGGAPKMLDELTESLEFLGVQSSNKSTDMTLKTAKEDENSLYTILKLMNKAAEEK